jgi:hypothetical protein
VAGYFPNKTIWYLYNDTSGRVILKHSYTAGDKVFCPHCGNSLTVEGYAASCCDEKFRVSFGEIRQVSPQDYHEESFNRGWKSLRPFDQHPPKGDIT